MLSLIFIASVRHCLNLNSGRFRIWKSVSKPLYSPDDLGMAAQKKIKSILHPFHVDDIFVMAFLFPRQK